MTDGHCLSTVRCTCCLFPCSGRPKSLFCFNFCSHSVVFHFCFYWTSSRWVAYAIARTFNNFNWISDFLALLLRYIYTFTLSLSLPSSLSPSLSLSFIQKTMELLCVMMTISAGRYRQRTVTTVAYFVVQHTKSQYAKLEWHASNVNYI